jgi:hypothetical protein
MSDQITEPTPTSVEPPWRLSAKGSIYCMWGNLQDDLKSQLQQQDKFGITIGDYHYNVKQNQDGGFVVFRNTKTEYDTNRQQFFNKNSQRTVEIKAIQIEQANRLLDTTEGYELIGNDPIKVVNGEFFAIIGKKVKK